MGPDGLDSGRRSLGDEAPVTETMGGASGRAGSLGGGARRRLFLRGSPLPSANLTSRLGYLFIYPRVPAQCLPEVHKIAA